MGRLPYVLGAVLAVVLLALGPLLVPSGGLSLVPPAHAAPAAEQAVTVRIEHAAPVSGSAGQRLRMVGTVKNTGGVSLREVQAHVWSDSAAITTPEGLEAARRSPPEQPLGARLLSPELGNVFTITDVGSQISQSFPGGRLTLDPGQSAPFTVEAAITGEDSLGLDAPGVHLVGVHVRGIPLGQENQTLGRARTFFVRTPDDGAVRHAPSTAVVQLSSRPSRVGEKVFVDDHLAGELQGRLADLMTLAEQPGTALLVDPTLVDSLQAMAAGYQVRAAKGSTPQASTTAGSRLAKDFLARLEARVAKGQTWRLPAGTPDLALAAGSGHARVVADAAAPLPDGHLLAGRPLALAPAGGLLDEASLVAARNLSPSLVLVSDTASTAAVQKLTADGPAAVVRVRTDLFNGAPGPEPSTTPDQVAAGLQAQQFLAREPVVSLVTTTEQARAETTAAPWRTRTPVTSLLSSADQAPKLALAKAPSRVNDQAWMAALDAAEGELAARGELTARQGEDPHRLGHQVLGQALSSEWGRHRGQALSWLARVREEQTQVLSGAPVRLHVVEDFVTSGPEQQVPVTISNGLDETVHAKVVFTSENPQRIQVRDSAVHSVGPGERTTVKMVVDARANGPVGVQAQLVTPQGTPVGPPRNLTVTATQAGRVGWLIIICSGVVFLAGTAVRIRQVQRERRESANVTGAR